MVRPKPKTLTSKHATGWEKVLLTGKNREQDHAHMRWWSGWIDGESGRGTYGHITTRDIDVGQCKAHQQQRSGPLSLFCWTQMAHFLHIQSKSGLWHHRSLPSEGVVALPLCRLPVIIRTGGLRVHDCNCNFFQTCDMWKIKPCDDPTSCTCFNLTAAVCVVCLHYRRVCPSEGCHGEKETDSKGRTRLALRDPLVYPLQSGVCARRQPETRRKSLLSTAANVQIK